MVKAIRKEFLKSNNIRFPDDNRISGFYSITEDHELTGYYKLPEKIDCCFADYFSIVLFDGINECNVRRVIYHEFGHLLDNFLHVSCDSEFIEILKKYKNNDILDTYTKTKQKLEIELETIKNNLDNMYIDKLQNKITEEMYRRIQEKFNKEISLKKDKLNEINEHLEKINKDEDAFSTIKKEVLEFKDRYPTRDLILKLIKNISIHEDGNIDIYFNFKELNFIYNMRDA